MVLVCAFFAPIHRYFPTCGTQTTERINAPLRRSYADWLASSVAQEVVVVRWRNVLYLPWLGVGDIWNKPPTDARDWINMEWRSAHAIAQGYRLYGRGYATPDAVLRLIVRWEQEHDEMLPRNAEGYVTREGLWRLPDCDLKRAALTTADDLPGDRQDRPW